MPFPIRLRPLFRPGPVAGAIPAEAAVIAIDHVAVDRPREIDGLVAIEVGHHEDALDRVSFDCALEGQGLAVPQIDLA